MKIALINPNRNIRYPSIHLGIGYIAAYLLKHIPDIEIQIFDTRIAKPKELALLFKTEFDLVGISASSQVFIEALGIANKIKTKYPQTHICIGGAYPSTVKDEALEEKCFDFAVYGEGEESFLELIKYLSGEINLHSINGLIYRNAENIIITNPSRAVIDNIDGIPIPAYHLFKMDRYPQHRIATSRGCPFDCVFCNSSTIWTRKWRMRDASAIIDEMSYLISNFGKKIFTFNDDSFNINQKRVFEFCNGLILHKLNILWSVPIRVDLVSSELALKMKTAGCYSVSIGIESANNEVLKIINKNSTIEKISEGIQFLVEAGIDVTGQFMIGNPGDTLDTIKESIDFAQHSKLTNVEFYTALPYKGSELWHFVQNHAKMLTDLKSYHFHEIEPRIIFETADFTLTERLTAIELAKKYGYYNALSNDNKSNLLDFGKNIASIFQKTFSGSLGNKIYIVMRNTYRKMTSK